MSISLRRIRSHSVVIALAAVIFVLLSPIQAQAAFQTAASASPVVGTNTLAPVGAANASLRCGLLTVAYLRVSWTISPSAFAAGYLITPVLNGVPQTSARVQVTDRTTTFADVPVQRSPLIGTARNYTFQVQATYLNWTSTTVTTTNPLSCGPL